MKNNRYSDSLAKEIERKFVIDNLPEDLDLSKYPSEKIYQGYLANTPEVSVRIRRKGNKYFWTIKRPPTRHAAERDELETEITQNQFNTMWPGTESRRLEKTRYRIAAGEQVIELDLFEGSNSGHMLAEVEFISTTVADKFIPPDWFGAEVTKDKRYTNASIAEVGFPNES